MNIQQKKMDAGLVVDRAEQIKWWDALEAITENGDVEAGLDMARACRRRAMVGRPLP
jgi:hypothetical protein